MGIKYDTVHCDDFWEFAEVMCDYGDVTVSYIGDFEDCAELLKMIFNLDYDDFTINSIDMATPEICGYDGPYTLTVTSEGEIYCTQSIWEDDKFYRNGSEVLYVNKRYLDQAIDSCDKNEDCEIIIAFVGDNEEDDVRHSMSIIQNEDGKPCGFVYHENSDSGECFDYTYCSCTPLSLNEVFEKFNKMMEGFKR